MISREELAQEYINVVNHYYPKAGSVLVYCHVKIIKLYFEFARKHGYYLGIYYPENISAQLLAQQDVLKEAAENMGLMEVVFINANRLIRDPLSKIKQENPRLWLELYWIASHNN